MRPVFTRSKTPKLTQLPVAYSCSRVLSVDACCYCPEKRAPPNATAGLEADCFSCSLCASAITRGRIAAAGLEL
ncbi:hypothetical protein GUJ93_ZPchr0012g18834 [Zizania palustris]|uniref:Uncharacterized protein n=1 Tax=Zizania palustris TaxID=103762 RepID=A0A8J6BSP9_ZIZPA|nr:hypothetical protein GUJ93_ZPchr0012g18834 [Zizania palustris]